MTGNGATNVFEESSAAADVTAQDLMTTDPVTVDYEMEFPKVLREMENAAARRIPITKDGDVVGIVTLDDCLTRIAGESEQVSAKLGSLAGVVRKESPDQE
jgi:CBS domain-containing protein